jgi:hypothetical protein
MIVGLPTSTPAFQMAALYGAPTFPTTPAHEAATSTFPGRDMRCYVEARQAVYVNYLDYDVSEHAFGPESRRALASPPPGGPGMQLWRGLRRVPVRLFVPHATASGWRECCWQVTCPV